MHRSELPKRIPRIRPHSAVGAASAQVRDLRCVRLLNCLNEDRVERSTVRHGQPGNNPKTV